MKRVLLGISVIVAMTTSVGAAVSHPAGGGGGGGGSSVLITLAMYAFFAIVIIGGIWFFRGPARRAEEYVNTLCAQFPNEADRQLFMQMYRNKGPKNVVIAWLLSAFLSPTVSYIYQGKWSLAIISFITLQGFFIWWIIALFTMPSEVLNLNKKLADMAYTELRVARPNAFVATGA
ncbi:MAG: TM2 domain-containing protein [Candidatus Eremiobacteraeota bacterium]|nr:TM2 domain-containing protein [Candidatus Eremiobacteraeota bacterium]